MPIYGLSVVCTALLQAVGALERVCCGVSECTVAPRGGYIEPGEAVQFPACPTALIFPGSLPNWGKLTGDWFRRCFCPRVGAKNKEITITNGFHAEALPGLPGDGLLGFSRPVPDLLRALSVCVCLHRQAVARTWFLLLCVVTFPRCNSDPLLRPLSVYGR